MSDFPEVEGRINEIFRSPIATKMLKDAIDRGNASGLANVIMTYIVEWDGEETAFDASEALITQPTPGHFIIFKINGTWYSLCDALKGRVDRHSAESEVIVFVNSMPVAPDKWSSTARNLTAGYGSTMGEAMEDARNSVLQMLNVKAPKGQDFRWLTQGDVETIFGGPV